MHLDHRRTLLFGYGGHQAVHSRERWGIRAGDAVRLCDEDDLDAPGQSLLNEALQPGSEAVRPALVVMRCVDDQGRRIPVDPALPEVPVHLAEAVAADGRVDAFVASALRALVEQGLGSPHPGLLLRARAGAGGLRRARDDDPMGSGLRVPRVAALDVAEQILRARVLPVGLLPSQLLTRVGIEALPVRHQAENGSDRDHQHAGEHQIEEQQVFIARGQPPSEDQEGSPREDEQHGRGGRDHCPPISGSVEGVLDHAAVPEDDPKVVDQGGSGAAPESDPLWSCHASPVALDLLSVQEHRESRLGESKLHPLPPAEGDIRKLTQLSLAQEFSLRGHRQERWPVGPPGPDPDAGVVLASPIERERQV